MFNEYIKWFFNTSTVSNNNYIVIIKQINFVYEVFYEL